MLSIGQMSKICGVSVKTLRHYDRIGLLRPVYTGGENGYRYYEEEQIPTMLLIGRLKRYGFRLSEVAMLLRGPAARLPGELQRQKTRLEWQMNNLSAVIREMEQHIDSLERTGDIMNYQEQYVVAAETSEELVLLTLRQKMSLDDFGNYYSRLYEQIAREKLAVTGITAAIYHDQEFDPGCSDIELAVGIREREQATLVLPARLCAVTTHYGPYSGLTDAYGALARWMGSKGYEMDGAPFEIYRKTGLHGLPPEQWETTVYFPIRAKQKI